MAVCSSKLTSLFPDDTLLDRLQKDVGLCAEGYLFELERRGYLKAGAYVL